MPNAHPPKSTRIHIFKIRKILKNLDKTGIGVDPSKRKHKMTKTQSRTLQSHKQ